METARTPEGLSAATAVAYLCPHHAHPSAHSSDRLHRAVPPHQKLISCRQKLHEIKHDGFNVTFPKHRLPIAALQIYFHEVHHLHRHWHEKKVGGKCGDKNIITITLATLAFIFSIASFTLTFRQRGIEDRRNTRKALTDIVAELTKVSIAYKQLDLDYPPIGSTDCR